VLDALRDGIGAEALGLFDDDRGDRAADGDAATARLGEPNFWEAFDGLPCAEVDWRSWYRRLRSDGQVESTCSCGQAHRLSGYLIHDRWALLLVTSHTWRPGASGRRLVVGEVAGRQAATGPQAGPVALELQARLTPRTPACPRPVRCGGCAR
jgi:hypothetical protein